MDKQRTIFSLSAGEDFNVILTVSLNMALCLLFMFLAIVTKDSVAWNLTAFILVAYTYFMEKLDDKLKSIIE